MAPLLLSTQISIGFVTALAVGSGIIDMVNGSESQTTLLVVTRTKNSVVSFKLTSNWLLFVAPAMGVETPSFSVNHSI